MTMKIFGWMHKKLLLGTTEYHRVAPRNSPDMIFDDDASEKNDTLLAASEQRAEDDIDALLLPHVLLTIGTFGHSTHLQHQQILHEELDHDGQEQVSTFIAKTTSATVAKPEPVIGELKMMDIIIKQEEIVEEETMSEEPLLKEDKEKVEKRTTLADLFAAEPVPTNDPVWPVDKSATDRRQKARPKKKNDKMTKKEKDQSRVSTSATKKVHQLITKMLKKKIHPDVARADQESHGRREGVPAPGGGEGGM